VRFSQAPSDGGDESLKGSGNDNDAAQLNATQWNPAIDVAEGHVGTDARPSAPDVEPAQWEGGSLLDVNTTPGDMPETLLPTPDVATRNVADAAIVASDESKVDHDEGVAATTPSDDMQDVAASTRGSSVKTASRSATENELIQARYVHTFFSFNASLSLAVARLSYSYRFFLRA
jgi:hypothetical protein